MAAQKTSRVPLADILRLPEYQSANRAQKLWIKLYLSSGETSGVYDPIEPTRLAYPNCSEKYLATRAQHVQSHKRVREILSIAFGKPLLPSILPGLDAAIQRSIRSDMKSGGGLSTATTRAIQFYENQRRIAQAKDADSDALKYAIGSIIEQEGVRYRVTAVEITEDK